MRKEFVMRGKTASGDTEVLNFSGFKPGMAYKMTEFSLFGSTGLGASSVELAGTVTAGKVAVSPAAPDYDNQGLIATYFGTSPSGSAATGFNSVVNDTFLITQNLILMVEETANGTPVNWQCKFERVKMTGPEEAVTNYKQFAISDE